MYKIRSFSKRSPRLPTPIVIQPHQPPLHIWIIVSYHLQIALKQIMIRDIKPHDCRIEPNVSFGDMFTQEIRPSILSENALHSIKTFEHSDTTLLVHLLLRGKSGFVDAIVEAVIRPLVQGFDPNFQMLGKEAFTRFVRFSQFSRQDRIEVAVQHADYLSAFVTDDGGVLFVPEHGDGIATFVCGVGFEVELAMVSEAVDGITGCSP